jgi:hypothetical protein
MHHNHFQTHLRIENFLQVNGRQDDGPYYQDKKANPLALQ